MIEGLRAVGGGIWFILVTPRVWPFAAVPMVLLVLLSCGLGALGVVGAEALSRWAVGEPESVWGYLGGWLITITLVVTFLIAALLLALVLAQPFSAFALEGISRAQERALCGDNLRHSSFLTALLASLRATLVAVVLGGGIFAVLFAIEVFFPPATVVTAPLWLLISGWLLAWNFLDYPLSLRGLGVLARLRWTFSHFEEVTVFGVAWASLLIVPGVFLLVLPMGVAGATRLVVERELAEADATRCY